MIVKDQVKSSQVRCLRFCFFRENESSKLLNDENIKSNLSVSQFEFRRSEPEKDFSCSDLRVVRYRESPIINFR